MKMLTRILILTWFATAATAAAQDNGVAEGRLVNRTDPAIVVGNVELEVFALSGGMDIIRTATTDARGAFRIEALPDTMPLMLRAVYKGVNYHEMLVFDANGKAGLELDVYEPTASMRDISVEMATMAFQLEEDYLHAVETLAVINSTSPPRVYVNPEGSFRVYKTRGVLEPPHIRITARGTGMPLSQSALESADGESYYSLYPLRPGGTIFEVHQMLPYTEGEYVYEKKFFHDIPAFSVGVIPFDMALSGDGIRMTEEHAAENFAVYAADAVRAGDAIRWTFTGGTPVAANDRGESIIVAMDDVVGQNALMLGSMILMVFIIVLWFALNRREPEQELR